MDCPTCSSSVTLDLDSDHPPTTSLVDAVSGAEVDDSIEVVRSCWDCGWREERTIRVEAIDQSDGDRRTIERLSLIDEISSEVEEVEHVERLEAVLAAVRRSKESP